MLYDIIGKNVFHKKFGTGIIVSKNDNAIISVQFDDAEKKFAFEYPDAFEKQWLITDDAELKAQAEQDIQQKKSDVQKSKKNISSVNHALKMGYKPKTGEPSNIAFKYNYCDGGETEEYFGFNGACSDKMIQYNTEVKKRGWCSHADCPCKQYKDGKISRTELDQMMKDDGFVCQESAFFRYWDAYPERHNEFVRLTRARRNSLAILTTTKPYDTGKNRVIFAVFLVDECSEGDDKASGYVKENPDWRIELTKQEADQMLFWNYYAYENSSSFSWSGIVRYISDDIAVQILRDIVNVIAPEYKNYAQEFLQYYCEINRINADDIPLPSGALLRKS